MILKYFRTNQPAILLVLPLVSLIFWVPHFFDFEKAFISRGFVFESLPELSNLSPWVFKISAFICITLQAFMINALLNNTEVFSKISHVPALIYVILASMMSHRGGMEPFIFSNFFILMALRSALQVYHQNSAIGITFNIGFWIGMASLFEPACLILIIPAIVSVLILRAADWRELLFIFIGAGLPFLMLWTLFFVMDKSLVLPENYFQFKFNAFPHSQSALFIFFLSMLGLIVLQSLYTYFTSMRGIILRVRKMRLVLFYFSFFLILMYTGLYFTSFSPLQNQILLIAGVILVSFRLIQPARPIFTDFTFYMVIVVWGLFVYNLYFRVS